MSDVDPETGEPRPEAYEKIKEHRKKYGVEIPECFLEIPDYIKIMSEEEMVAYSKMLRDVNARMPTFFPSDRVNLES